MPSDKVCIGLLGSAGGSNSLRTPPERTVVPVGSNPPRGVPATPPSRFRLEPLCRAVDFIATIEAEAALEEPDGLRLEPLRRLEDFTENFLPPRGESFPLWAVASSST